ncbi:heavy-metal-associated domain-containing protein [Campylobacter concisus]|mgnify:FL=1|jgi:mercuric transport protein periplasmic component (periplasmic mercury ion-binding protein) (mercury scavenger protein)|uniref:Heavy-metal-associated domain-containing protein n=1 Tax=Campylobacter concisus TaxID=199 RepID=A0AAE7P289_9BACT|nr:heavy metal-associated domain-containing protein [Campylobacter concisus]QPH86611.1 heavy-metal-associated domain-containing protein [Campylobacter concisus]
MRKILVLALLVAASYADKKIEILVPSMHCPLCTAIVRKAALSVDGVKKADVSLKERKAVVIADDKVDEKELLKAVDATGYKGEIK